VGKDGLVHVVTKAELNVKDVQKSLNQMSKEERIQFIRNQGDPKISVTITVRDADKVSEAPAEPSQIAENIVKERIQAFGFRVWSQDVAAKPAAGAPTADFAIIGEAKFKKLTHRLEASGIVIEKVVLTSWTVKCLDRRTGEEIYYNTKIPEKQSWNDKDSALRDIGKLIGDEFSKDFFLQHFSASGQRATLRLEGLPSKDAAEQVLREMTALRQVLSVSLAPSGTAAVYDLELSGGTASASELVAEAILKPLNAKLGKQCFNLTSSAGSEVSVGFEKLCADPAILGRLDTLPPAALFAAPPARQKSVVKNPEVLKKLTI
jgi:eukaryotic-like serine/threonine-protein kinase